MSKKPTTQKFKPLNNNVLVSLIEHTVSPGGILLDGAKNNGVVTGTVLDIGEDIFDIYGKKISINVKIGDTVYFLKRDVFEVIPLSGQYLLAYKSLIGKAE